MRKRLWTTITVLLILVLFPTTVLAGTQSWTNGDTTITFTTPDSYSLCPVDGASDSISVTGLPAGYTLKGYVQTQYVLEGGVRQLINQYNVDFVSDGANPFSLTVAYPPTAEWPLGDPTNGTYEIHVDIAMLVAYDASGLMVGWVGNSAAPGTLGPGNDWDVYCQKTPPTKTPPPPTETPPPPTETPPPPTETPPPPTETPPPSIGTGTRGYWANHAEAWPVSSILIGSTTYSVSEAIGIMQTPGKGDKTYDLFAQLVAAKLNGYNGAETSCVDGAIAAADAWLSVNTLGSGVRAKSAAWSEISTVFSTLDSYNNGLLCAPHRD